MSEINPFQSVDYLEEARGRVTEQFKNKIVFDRYLQLMVQSNIEIEEVFRQLMQERSIDTAVGAQLDIIGDIVGQDRTLLSVDVLDYFGFQGKVNAGSFGTLEDPTAGEIFFSLDSPVAGNVQLSDDVYRLFIKAKIAKNNTSATPEDTEQAIRMIFGVDKVQITEGVANFTVLVGKKLSSMERELLNYVSYSSGYPSRLIPKPIGVGVKFGQFDGNNFFGFAGVRDAKGFGTLISVADYGVGYGNNYGQSINDLAPNVGGKFATLF